MSHRSDPRAWPEERRDLLPFLPLVYVAWCDGNLSDDEIEAVRDRARRADWLDDASRSSLDGWLEPDNPPTASELEELRELIRDSVAELDDSHDRTLGRLGVELARTLGSGDEPWCSEAAEALVEELEDLAGVLGREASRALLVGDEPPEPGDEEEPSALFDVDAMNAHLDAPHRDVRREVLELLGSEAYRFPRDLSRSEYRERVLDAVRELADRGYGLTAVPEEYGGAGDQGRAIAVFESLAYGDLSVLVKFGVQFGLFGGSIQQLGSARHHEEYLRAMGTLELPGCFAMTEMDHGSNVRQIGTVARYLPDSGEFEIHTPSDGARKDWIGNAALHGRMATVFAQLAVDGEEHGVHAFLVPIRDDGGDPLPGVTIEDRGWKEGLNGVDNGILGFDRVRVPRENLLNRFADVTPDGEYTSPIPGSGRRFFTMLGTLVAGRISIAAASVVAARTGLTIAVRYGDRRRQFGPEGRPEVPLLDYRVHQRVLLPRLATTYGLIFAVRDLIRRYVELKQSSHDPAREPGGGTEGAGDPGHEEEQRRIEGLAAGLKALASWHAVDTLQACREACGGRGYDWDNRFGELKGDVDVFTTFEGANTVLLQLVAKGLLSRYKEEMGDLRLWGIVRYVADRAETRLSEMNPVATRRTDEEHLVDPDFHLSAFRYREDRLLTTAAQRLKALLDDGRDSFDAMNQCQDHLVTLAEAHVERVVLECFQEGVKKAPTPGLSEILRELSALYALSRLEEHKGWYLESGYMEGGKTKAVRAMVNQLCHDLRDQAVFLVDAFGIPDDVLRAPAGL